MLGPFPLNINFAGINPVALATVLFNHDCMGNKLCSCDFLYSISEKTEIFFTHLSPGFV
jgi:hypothetical protein